MKIVRVGSIHHGTFPPGTLLVVPDEEVRQDESGAYFRNASVGYTGRGRGWSPCEVVDPVTLGLTEHKVSQWPEPLS